MHCLAAAAPRCRFANCRLSHSCAVAVVISFSTRQVNYPTICVYYPNTRQAAPRRRDGCASYSELPRPPSSQDYFHECRICVPQCLSPRGITRFRRGSDRPRDNTRRRFSMTQVRNPTRRSRVTTPFHPYPFRHDPNNLALPPFPRYLRALIPTRVLRTRQGRRFNASSTRF